MSSLKSRSYSDYFRNKKELHNKLERQLREELLKLEAKQEEAVDPNLALRQEVEALLQRYNFSLAEMFAILT